ALQETKSESISIMDIRFMWGNSNFQYAYSDSVGSSGDRHLSDHRPIILREIQADFGLTPFRMYHSWFIRDGFDVMIRRWAKKLLINQLVEIDLEIDNGNVTDDLLLKRLEVSNKLFEEKSLDTKDAAKKAKVRWAIEGDENSKFFHGIINKRRSQLAIRGVFVNGVWLTDPGSMKLTCHDHFADRFKQPTSTRFKINTEFPNRLSSDQIRDLDKSISVEEIKAAVWDCGENKSPGPDGYTFEFYRHFWDLISNDFCAAITYFFDHGSFPRGGNSSFIALIPKVIDTKFVNDFRPISLIGSVYKVVTKILATRLSYVIASLVSNTQSAFIKNRQILDGPFILSETIAWCKSKKKQALIFKVDFAKAYDSSAFIKNRQILDGPLILSETIAWCKSKKKQALIFKVDFAKAYDFVRWDFLLDTLQAFGFSSKWCFWIWGIFSSNMASILVNGSPSMEFPIACGLKQGDPLAPFLFILVMESLHISVTRACNEGIFKGLRIHDSLVRSHLFYADDAVFIGECIGCATMTLPFKYLGVTVGDHMSRHSAWFNVVQKINSRLSKWKAKTLSVGGRLTLIKVVLGAIPLYHMSLYKMPKGIRHELEMTRNKFFLGADPGEKKISWVAWEKVLASKCKCGLGVSSYFAFNRALLIKWVWRLFSQDGSLWSQVIHAIYGASFEENPYKSNTCWNSILREVRYMSHKGKFVFGGICPVPGVRLSPIQILGSLVFGC
nr:putative RNA-directed DNA polymerase, eukaryota, reverse transcriptase zinc-binding domain protein [Tanacetum cinerariifolium]